MAYNIPSSYKDKTPAATLDKKTLNRMVWRSLFLQASFNYERMQAGGWLYAIIPGLEKIHKDKDDLACSMSHNLEFFNTHPFLVTLVMGIILSLEQNKADIPTIRAVRVAAMGPLGGIGDALFWLTLVPITAGITSNMALGGNVAAPFIFLLIFNVAQFAVRYFLMHWSYKMGVSAIDILTRNAKEFTRAASILGVFVVGALIAVYGGTKLSIVKNNGVTNVALPVTAVVENDKLDDYGKVLFQEDGKTLKAGSAITDLGNGHSQITFNRYEQQSVQVDFQKVLDTVLPKIIPLFLTLLLYFLMVKRRFTPIKSIVLLIILGLLGSFIPAIFNLPSIWG